MAKVALALLCLPFACFFFGMVLYAVLPPFLFWVAVILLATWAARAIVKMAETSKR